MTQCLNYSTIYMDYSLSVMLPMSHNIFVITYEIVIIWMTFNYLTIDLAYIWSGAVMKKWFTVKTLIHDVCHSTLPIFHTDIVYRIIRYCTMNYLWNRKDMTLFNHYSTINKTLSLSVGILISHRLRAIFLES